MRPAKTVLSKPSAYFGLVCILFALALTRSKLHKQVVFGLPDVELKVLLL